jgi:hypothetical protein
MGAETGACYISNRFVRARRLEISVFSPPSVDMIGKHWGRCLTLPLYARTRAARAPMQDEAGESGLSGLSCWLGWKTNQIEPKRPEGPLRSFGGGFF